MKPKKILLTGGTGLVGKNFLDLAARSDIRVLAPNRSSLDLSDFDEVNNWISREKPDAIIHAAGLVGGIQANLANPVAFLVENTDLARNVILAARRNGIKYLINLGSSCIYPKAAPNPLTEDLLLTGPLEPTNEGYALAKLFAVKLCSYIRLQDQTKFYKTLIPCNLFGKYDKFDPHNSHLIPAIIHKTHEAKKNQATSVEIWGDGSARREFMYAGDFARIIQLALENIEEIPDVMNVGTGQDYSINEYYECVSSVVGFNGKFLHNTDKPVGMNRKIVDISQQKKMGWINLTPLEEGVRETYAYYLEELNK